MSVSNAWPYATKLPSKSSCQFQQRTQNPSSDATFLSPLVTPPHHRTRTALHIRQGLRAYHGGQSLPHFRLPQMRRQRIGDFVSLTVDPQVHSRKIFISEISVYNNSTKLSKNPLWNCAGIAAIDQGHEGARRMLHRMIGIGAYCWMLDDRERV